MIKKLFLAFVLNTSGVGSASAQYEIWDVLVGGKVGGSAGMLTKRTCDPLWGPYGGVYAEMYLNKWLSMSLEVAAAHKGADNVKTRVDDGYAYYQYRMDYINTSYLFNVHMFRQHLSLYTGLSLGRAFNAKAMRNNHSVDIMDYVHKGEFTVPVGVELTIGKHITLDGRWHWSPLKISDSERATRAFGASRHQFFSVTLGYKTQVF